MPASDQTMRAFLSINALLVAAACFCLKSANAADTKFHPAVIEMYRCQDALQMTLDLLPLCTHDDWDVQSITKAAQAHAQYEYEIRKACKDWDPKNPNDKPVKEAEERRDQFWEASLTKNQIHQLLELKGITDLISEQSGAASDAYAASYAKKLPEIISKSQVLTAQEVSGWKISVQDLSEVLQEMKNNPKLAFPEIQSAVVLSQEALKDFPEKAAALVKQITETLQKGEVVM
jgi:hypothetical protein